MRQARRSYRHLPAEMHEQAYDVAAVALIDGASDPSDRRALYADLAHHLDEALRYLHVGWCLNSSKAGLKDPVIEDASAPPRTHSGSAQVADFLERGLGGLERAVLQLELGAGRDTSVVRAALRLGPRQYSRHREGGLAKLRAVIGSQVASRVCEQHAQAVVLAATGDDWAADSLATGPGRCRSCAREASSLRRMLNERLALAAWPLAIKPAGLIAAKMGAAGAILKGNAAGAGISASGTPTVTSFGGVKAVATVLAVAAGAGGTAAVVDDKEKVLVAPVSPAVQKAVNSTKPASAASAGASSGASSTSTRATRAAEKTKTRKAATKSPAQTASTQAAAQDAQTSSGSGSQSGLGTTAVTKPDVKDTVDKAVSGVKKTVTDVKKTVTDTAKVVPTVQVQGLPPVDVGDTVGDVSNSVDSLLKP
jgi:hypothetical protein